MGFREDCLLYSLDRLYTFCKHLNEVWNGCMSTVDDGGRNGRRRGEHVGRHGRAARSPLVVGDVERLVYRAVK